MFIYAAARTIRKREVWNRASAGRANADDYT